MAHTIDPPLRRTFRVIPKPTIITPLPFGPRGPVDDFLAQLISDPDDFVLVDIPPQGSNPGPQIRIHRRLIYHYSQYFKEACENFTNKTSEIKVSVDDPLIDEPGLLHFLEWLYRSFNEKTAFNPNFAHNEVYAKRTAVVAKALGARGFEAYCHLSSTSMPDPALVSTDSLLSKDPPEYQPPPDYSKPTSQPKPSGGNTQCNAWTEPQRSVALRILIASVYISLAIEFVVSTILLVIQVLRQRHDPNPPLVMGSVIMSAFLFWHAHLYSTDIGPYRSILHITLLFLVGTWVWISGGVKMEQMDHRSVVWGIYVALLSLYGNCCLLCLFEIREHGKWLADMFRYNVWVETGQRIDW